jgi:hypothetical protein
MSMPLRDLTCPQGCDISLFPFSALFSWGGGKKNMFQIVQMKKAEDVEVR